MTGLPKGWERAPIGMLCDLKNGMAFKPTDWSRTGMKIVRIQNLNNPDASFNYFEGEIRDRFIINRGDLLFAWSGTPGTSFGAHIWRGERAVLNQHIFRVDFDEACLNKSFFRLAINQKLGELIGKAHGGAGLQHVTKGRFEETLIEIPPLAEQHRIVAKIEALFSELDAGHDSLTRTQAQLRLYRQSLLKASFQGRLTAYWRAANPDKLEAPKTLLSRIRSERDARYKQALEDWQHALSEWRAGVETGRKPGKPSRLEQVEILSEGQAALPMGWIMVKVASLCEVVRGGSPRPAGDPRYYGGDIPFLKVADLTRVPGMRISGFTFTITEAGLTKTRFTPPGTLMISNSGATLGVPKICEIAATFNDGIAAFLGLSDQEQEYHYYFWESQTAELRGLNQGAAQPNLNTTILADMPIPVCSDEEMAEVVSRLSAMMSQVDAMGTEITTALAKITALRQSILKQAFSGRLVPQDPTDEPASALLARLRDTTPTTEVKRGRKVSA